MSHPRATIAISGRRYDEPFRHRTDRRGSQTARSASTRRARRSHAGHGPHRRRDGDGKGARRATPAPALGTRGADLSLPSRRKCACPVSPIRARLTSFTAAKPSKRPSVFCASHTDPIPPCPSGRRRVYWPSVRPARLVAGGPARKPRSSARASAERRSASGLTSSGDCAASARIHASLSAPLRSSARSSSGPRTGHWSGSICGIPLRAAARQPIDCATLPAFGGEGQRGSEDHQRRNRSVRRCRVSHAVTHSPTMPIAPGSSKAWPAPSTSCSVTGSASR